MLMQGAVVYSMLQPSLTGGTDKQASVTTWHQQCDLGGEAEGQPIRRSPLGRLTAPHQGEEVGVADLECSLAFLR